MSAQPALLRKCIDEAVAASGPLIDRCVDEAVRKLQEAENQGTRMADRHELADAWRELHQQRAHWARGYPEALRAAMAEAAPSQNTPAMDTRGAPLTLVDDDQVAQDIDSARLAQQLRTVVELPLAELDGLVCATLGLPAVRPEENPVRPEIFARALRAMMSSTAKQPAFLSLWTRHLAAPLGRELEPLYRQLARTLTVANVQAVTYRVLPSQQTAPPPGAAPGATGVAPDQPPGTQRQGGGWDGASGHAPLSSNDPRIRGGSAWADLSGHDLGDGLIQEFLYRGGSQSQSPLAPAYYERVSNELADLEARPRDEAPVFDSDWVRQYQEMPAVDRPARQVSTDSPLDHEVWGSYGGSRERSLVRTRLKKKAKQVGQVLGLEVVRKLVNQVAQDPRLLAPVRESIVALEPSLLRLAMVDPRFFSEEQHAGRRLVERVAERSFKFNDEFSQEFKDFSASVAATFNALNRLETVDDAHPFQSALDKLENGWTAQDAQEKQQQGEVLDAVRRAEQRQAQADQIAWDLSQRSDLDGVPEVVQDFLYGPWSLVMAHARLSDPSHIDPDGYGAIVSDLLWSVKRDITLRQPSKLIAMIPGLLDKLRSGLSALGQTPQESESFFHTLEKLHQPVLKLRERKRRDESDSQAMDLEQLFEPDADVPPPAARQQPKPVAQPWMGARELDAAGFEDTLPTDHAALIDLSEHRAAQADNEAQAASANVPAVAQAVAQGPQDADAEPAPESVAAPAPVDVAHIVAGLREGSWVDLNSKNQWLRAQLIWASNKGTLFMFTSHGGQPHSMTRRSLERLLRERLVRPVDTQGVVAQALDTVVSRAPQRQPLAA